MEPLHENGKYRIRTAQQFYNALTHPNQEFLNNYQTHESCPKCKTALSDKPLYRQESGNQGYLQGCKKCVITPVGAVIGKDGLCDECRGKGATA